MSAKKEYIEYVQKRLQTARRLAENKASSPVTKNRFPQRFVFERLIEHLSSFLDDNNRDQRWVAMPGLRGTGKSTLMAQAYLYLVQDRGLDAMDVLYVSMDSAVDQLGLGVRGVIDAYEAVSGEALDSVDSPRFILLDEVHFDQKWAQAVKDLYERAPNVFIIVTGSSALALQANNFLGADILRRMQIERVEPMRFTEYLKLKDNVDPLGFADDIAAALFKSVDSSEVEQRLLQLAPDIARYTAKYSSNDIQNFLVHGSLPFSIGLSREESLERMVGVTKEALRRDIQTYESAKFELDTINKFPKLVTLLSSWEDVSVKKLSDMLELNHVTVTNMVETLKKSGLIHAVPTYGGTATRTTRPPRYTFSASGIKAAFLWSIGQLGIGPEQYGLLLEDLFVHYFDVRGQLRVVDLFRIEKEAEADFMLKLHSGDLIACEVSFGSKGIEQVKQTMSRVKCKYGLVISKNQLARKGDVVFVPREFLFAY